MGQMCEKLDVTRENAFFRSDDKDNHLLGKMYNVMSNRPDVPMLLASQIGVDKRAIVLRVDGNGVAFILNPEILKKSGSKGGRYKTITLSFYDTTGIKQSVKFRGARSFLLQQGLKYMGMEI